MSADQMLLDDVLEAEGDWVGMGLAAVAALALTGRRFQAFDLVESLGLPEPKSSASWGALFRRAKSQGLIRRVGYAQSKRPTVAGSACAEWVGAA